MQESPQTVGLLKIACSSDGTGYWQLGLYCTQQVDF